MAAKTIKIEDKNLGTLYITATGFKTSAKGKVIKPNEFLPDLNDKGLRRRLRKTCRANGLMGHMGIPPKIAPSPNRDSKKHRRAERRLLALASI